MLHRSCYIYQAEISSLTPGLSCERDRLNLLFCILSFCFPKLDTFGCLFFLRRIAILLNLPDFFHFTWHTESLSFLLWLLSKIYHLPQVVFARGNTWVLSPQFFEDYHRKHNSLQCKALKVNFELFSSLKAWWGPSCTVQEQARLGNKTDP